MKSIFVTILRFAKPHKFLFVILFSCILITSFSGTFYPYIFGRLVDEVFYEKNMKAFTNIVILYGVIYFGNAFLHFVLNMTWAKLMTNFLFDIREACFYKTLKLKPEYLSNSSSGDLAERINNDVEEFMNLIHWNIFYTTATVIGLITTLVIVFNLNIWFFVIMLVLVPLTAVISKNYREKTNITYNDIGKRNGMLAGWVFEVIKGISEIRLLAAEKRVRNKFTTQNIYIARQYISAGWMYIKSQNITNGLMSFSRIIIFVMAAFFVYKGELTLGAFIASLDYFNNGVRGFQNLNSKSFEIQKNIAKIKRVTELLESEEERYSGVDLEITSEYKSGIVFEDLSFSYQNGENVLKNISFEIKNGETISLVGKSGSGKSTTASLMLRMYEPDEGRIFVYGQDLSVCSIASIRQNISIVLQEVILFDDTIRNNMLLAKKDAADDEIWLSLKSANLYDFIKGLENGLDTVIGKGGMNFSGGQRQRLSIARIFLKNPKIIILDEATSSLDAETEAAVQSAWQNLRKNRTTIIIAHRYSTIKNSDRVLVIDNGQLAAFDSHKNLFGQNAAYDALFKEQIIDAGLEKTVSI